MKNFLDNLSVWAANNNWLWLEELVNDLTDPNWRTPWK